MIFRDFRVVIRDPLDGMIIDCDVIDRIDNNEIIKNNAVS